MARERWIYGINSVSEAIKAQQRISTIYVMPQLDGHRKTLAERAAAKGIEVKSADRTFFDGLFPKGHQGIAARAQKKELLSVEDLFEVASSRDEPAFFLVLDCIEDPRNFGAIMRAADAAGVHGIVFQRHRSASVTETVAKASAGAVEHMNLVAVPNVKHAIRTFRESDIVILGAEAGAGRDFWKNNMTVPLALVIGSEGKGLRRLCERRATRL